jgi:penicillin-insensitive murein DD-endopeptidase
LVFFASSVLPRLQASSGKMGTVIRTLALILACVGLAAATVAWAGADFVTPAKVLFGEPGLPSDQPTRAIGSYARGCLAGGQALPFDGAHWQVVRLSRNRNWGTPRLIQYIEKLASDAATLDGWPGLLIGDMSQPRGGPMATGHASHQIGLDVDIWFVPMPSPPLTADEREKIPDVSLLEKGRLALDPLRWSDQDLALLKRAASYPEVARIFVSAAIKKRLCETASRDRKWLRKLRPWWGHDDHFHVRLKCPADMASCLGQESVRRGDGCGADLAAWLKRGSPRPSSSIILRPPVTLAGLPRACTDVLYAKAAPVEAANPGDNGAGKASSQVETGATVAGLRRAPRYAIMPDPFDPFRKHKASPVPEPEADP